MITSLPYLLEVQVCFVLLWAVYHAVIGRGGDFAASRVYLLSVPVLSLVIPLLDVPVFVRYVYLGPAARLADRLTEFSPIAEEAARSTPVVTDIVIAAAALGTMFFFVRFLVSLTAIRRMSHGVRKVTRNGISLYDSDSCPLPVLVLQEDIRQYQRDDPRVPGPDRRPRDGAYRTRTQLRPCVRRPRPPAAVVEPGGVVVAQVAGRSARVPGRPPSVEQGL